MMQKQGFHLQQVLNYRKEVERTRKLEFASAKHEFESAAERLQRDEDETRRLGHEFNSKQTAGITANELQMYADFFQRRTVDLQLQRVEVDSLNRQMSEKREVLLDAAKEKKALELLKEKRMLAIRRELAEKERNFLDEISIQKSASR